MEQIEDGLGASPVKMDWMNRVSDNSFLAGRRVHPL